MTQNVDSFMQEITICVICGRWLKPDRDHVDTCGERCYHILLKHQRRTRA